LFLNFARDQVVEVDANDNVIGRPVHTGLTADLVASLEVTSLAALAALTWMGRVRIVGVLATAATARRRRRPAWPVV